MPLKRWLFPKVSRFFPGQRWVNIGFRTLHLVGLAGLGAGFLYTGTDEIWRDYLSLTLWSGLGLAAILIWSNGIWLIQLRGQAILFKLLLLGLIPLRPDWAAGLLIGVIVISGVIAHAPANVRYFSPFHGRRVEQLD